VSIDAWWTLAVVVALIAVLASERLAAPLVVMGAVTLLLVTGVVDVDQALSGFSNEAPLTIAALYVVTGAVKRTGALDSFSRRTTGTRPMHPGQARARPAELARVVLPASGMSLFVYNTPTVALLAPQTAAWARRSGRSASWYLLALNYAVLLAGMITAIGTTTNVVTSGLLRAAHQHPLGLFELAPVGLPVLFVGLAVLIGVGGLVARSRRTPNESAAGGTREYTVEMTVPAGSPLAGLTVEQAGLRSLEGVFLVQIASGDRVIAPVSPTDALTVGAQLTFAGNVARVVDLQRMEGLVSAEERHFEPQGRFYEAVVGANSPLVGQTLQEAEFRGRYDAAVVAIHRAGERVSGKLGTVRLRTGDLLLVLAGDDFLLRWRDASDFGLVAPLDGAAPPPRRSRSWLVGLILVGFLVTAATGVLSVLEAALIAALAVVGLGVVTPTEARRSIDLDVLIVLAGSFGIGAAIAASGLASHIASALVSMAPSGRGWTLLAVLIATVILTQVVTNNAAAIIMFPVALSVAASLHTDPRAFAIAVTIGASCSFLTPIGYQTNMIVSGLGGYRFADFLPLGSILTVTTVAIAGTLIPLLW
jgi:di/tricarboxylate transporter